MPSSSMHTPRNLISLRLTSSITTRNGIRRGSSYLGVQRAAPHNARRSHRKGMAELAARQAGATLQGCQPVLDKSQRSCQRCRGFFFSAEDGARRQDRPQPSRALTPPAPCLSAGPGRAPSPQSGQARPLIRWEGPTLGGRELPAHIDFDHRLTGRLLRESDPVPHGEPPR